MFFSEPRQISAETQQQLSTDPDLRAKFDEVNILRFRQFSDTRGYLNLMADLQGKGTSEDRLASLRLELAEQPDQAVVFAYTTQPQMTRDRAEIWLKKLLRDTPKLSLERFRLSVVSVALENAPSAVSTPALSQTIFDSAKKISPILGLMVAADFFVSAKLQSER